MESLEAILRGHRRWVAQRVLRYLDTHLAEDGEASGWHNAVDALTEALLESLYVAQAPMAQTEPEALDAPEFEGLCAMVEGMARLHLSQGRSLALLMRFLKAGRRSYLELLLFSNLPRTQKHNLVHMIERRFEQMEVAACDAWDAEAAAVDRTDAVYLRLPEMIALCAQCKRVRDETGQWLPIEAYLYRHMGITVSHGICPHCLPQFEEGLATSP